MTVGGDYARGHEFTGQENGDNGSIRRWAWIADTLRNRGTGLVADLEGVGVMPQPRPMLLRRNRCSCISTATSRRSDTPGTIPMRIYFATASSCLSNGRAIIHGPVHNTTCTRFACCGIWRRTFLSRAIAIRNGGLVFQSRRVLDRSNSREPAVWGSSLDNTNLCPARDSGRILFGNYLPHIRQPAHTHPVSLILRLRDSGVPGKKEKERFELTVARTALDLPEPFSKRSGNLPVNYLRTVQSHPQSQLHGAGQQTRTGTCLQTTRGTQRVTVYGTHFGTHFRTVIVRFVWTGRHTVYGTFLTRFSFT